MARRTVEEISGAAPCLVYIAGNTVDAGKVERALTERGIDYTLTLEPFMNSPSPGAVLGGTYAGVFFFVPAAEHGRCREFLESRGFADTVPMEASMETADGA